MARNHDIETDTAARNEELRRAAARKLRAYLATGLTGFRRQGLDRARAAGINTAGCEACGDQGIEHLALCLENGDAY